MDENELSNKVIGAAIEVHRILGPGLLESAYEEALCHELHLNGIPFKRQQHVPLAYKGVKLATPLRLDLLVDEKIIVDLKAVEKTTKVDHIKTLTYLRLSKLRLGLNINFHEVLLKDGIKRIVNDLRSD